MTEKPKESVSRQENDKMEKQRQFFPPILISSCFKYIVELKIPRKKNISSNFQQLEILSIKRPDGTIFINRKDVENLLRDEVVKYVEESREKTKVKENKKQTKINKILRVYVNDFIANRVLEEINKKDNKLWNIDLYQPKKTSGNRETNTFISNIVFDEILFGKTIKMDRIQICKVVEEWYKMFYEQVKKSKHPYIMSTDFHHLRDFVESVLSISSNEKMEEENPFDFPIPSQNVNPQNEVGEETTISQVNPLEKTLQEVTNYSNNYISFDEEAFKRKMEEEEVSEQSFQQNFQNVPPQNDQQLSFSQIVDNQSEMRNQQHIEREEVVSNAHKSNQEEDSEMQTTRFNFSPGGGLGSWLNENTIFENGVIINVKDDPYYHWYM